MGIHTIADEPGRKIEMLESQVPVMNNGIRQNRYVYTARLNEGPWVDLTKDGNRIPSHW